MDNRDPDGMREERPKPPHPTTKKKVYSKPAFRFERVFETMALSCGKIHGTQVQCRFNRKNS